jgi:hypothetical protein
MMPTKSQIKTGLAIAFYVAFLGGGMLLDQSAFGLFWYFIVPTGTALFGLAGLASSVGPVHPTDRRRGIRLLVGCVLVGAMWLTITLNRWQ